MTSLRWFDVATAVNEPTISSSTTITTATTTCSINASTFVATASAGTYTSPVAAMASGDYGWFSAASV